MPEKYFCKNCKRRLARAHKDTLLHPGWCARSYAQAAQNRAAVAAMRQAAPKARRPRKRTRGLLLADAVAVLYPDVGKFDPPEIHVWDPPDLQAIATALVEKYLQRTEKQRIGRRRQEHDRRKRRAAERREILQNLHRYL